MAKYVYPAIFTPQVVDGNVQGYSVHFPGVGGCFPQGDTLAEAMLFAQEALASMLVELEGSLPYQITQFNKLRHCEGIHWIACDTDKVGV